MIEVNGITKKYRTKNGKGVTALSDFTLSIGRGEFLSVVGPSGSGKSTLLYAIGGMLMPTKGRILLQGTDVYGLSTGKRSRMRLTRYGFIFQTFNLISYLTCQENAAFPAMLAGCSRKDAMKKAAANLEELDMHHRLEHKPAALSVGERQRAAIARSLVNDPDVILADEPTGNLDPDMTREVIQIFNKIHRKGKTIIMVSHDNELTKEGERVVRLDRDPADKTGSIQ